MVDPALPVKTKAKAITWAVISAIVMGAVILALFAYSILSRDPANYCRIQLISEKAAGLRPEDCSALLLKLLSNDDHTNIGMLMLLGLAFWMLIARTIGADVEWTGPAGIGGKINHDQADDSVDATIKGDVTLTPTDKG